MNITLSVDDQVVSRAREKATALGKSLNQLVREYLEQLAGRHDPERVVRELRRLSAAAGGSSRGKRWTRDELHDRDA
jgi:hypothetical protein